MIELASEHEELRPRICVIGVGGAGGNAVANMIRNDVPGVTFVAANTDAQALRASPAERIVQLGRRTTEGLGAGSSAETGKAAAQESLDDIGRMLDGAHMCFIAAGLGGGTGTGAAPIIAKAARDKGILTVGVVTRPFGFEGARRARTADAGLKELQRHVDTLIVIPNQNLFRIANPDTTFKSAFDLADDVLHRGVRGITDLMVTPGLINLDFADIRTVMANMGKAMMGTGEAAGEDRAIRAAEQAVSNPLLDEALKGARGLIISISGGDDLRLMEVDEAANYVREMVHPEADIIWGSSFNPGLEGKIRVSVLATGIDAAAAQAPIAPCAPVPTLTPVFRPPVQAALPLEAPVRAPALLAPLEEPEEDELLLTMERALILAPPDGAPDIPTLDPFAGDSGRAAERGPSLFERMAESARGAVTGQRIARAA